jgi:hypothetical protein
MFKIWPYFGFLQHTVSFGVMFQGGCRIHAKWEEENEKKEEEEEEGEKDEEERCWLCRNL